MRNPFPTYQYWIIIILCLFISVPNVAQDETSDPNPFELRYRLDKSEQLAIVQPKGNPFDVSAPAESLKKKLKEAARYRDDFVIQINRYEGDVPIPKNWLLFIVIPLLLLVTTVATLFRDKLNQLFKSFTNSNMLSLAYREQFGRTNIHSFFLFSLSIISFGIFGFVLFIDSHINKENFLKAILFALTLSALYILLKYFCIYFVKSVFPHKKTMDYYQFMFSQYNHLLGIVLIPFSIFLSFAPTNAALIISYIAITLIGIWWIMRIIRGLQIGSKFISINIFRFFAYLCTVEIAPAIILLTILKLSLDF